MAEKLEIKIYRAKLHTAGKTPEQIIANYDEPKPSDEVVQDIIKAYDIIDGIEIMVSDSFYDAHGFTIVCWKKEDDDKFKEFIWLSEQDPLDGSYIGERERFDKDWDSNQYEPPGALTFAKEDLEILEELKRGKG